MKDAAKELHSKSNAADNDLINCNITCDGISRRKGGIFHLMALTTISMDTGTVLDVEIMGRFCKSCGVHHHLPEKSENYYSGKQTTSIARLIVRVLPQLFTGKTLVKSESSYSTRLFSPNTKSCNIAH